MVAGMIPLAPYLLPLALHTALVWSCVTTGVALAVFGAVKGRYTGEPALRSAVQTVAIGGTAAAVAYGIGRVVSRLGV